MRGKKRHYYEYIKTKRSNNTWTSELLEIGDIDEGNERVELN
jgi:hypothetical protein